MLISAPIIQTVDLLLVGLAPEAIQAALQAKKSGRSVFAMTSYTYPGEERAAHFDLQREPDDALRFFFPEGGPRTPMEYKYRLEQALIRNRIDFLYQVQPIAPVADEAGHFAGLLVADRTGFQVIAAKVVLDTTERAVAARLCGVPSKPFRPGVYIAERFLLGGAPTGSEILPGSTRIDHREYRTYCFRQQLEMCGTTPQDFARAESSVRLASWHPDTVYASDFCRIRLDDGVEPNYRPDAKLPVLTAAHLPQLPELLKSASPGVPVRVKNLTASPISPLELVRLDPPVRYRNTPQSLTFDLNHLPATVEKTDVLVVGGGTGGAPAAIAAARSGAATVCLETLSVLGGICTAGRICCYWFGNRVGFTAELDAGITALGPNPEFPVEHPCKNVDWKAYWLLRQAVHAGAEVRFGTAAVAVAREGNRLRGVLALGPCGLTLLQAEALVDATGNADVAAAAGAATRMAAAREPAVQGAGLSPVTPGISYTNTDFQFICDHDIADATRAFVMGRAKFLRKFDLIQIPNTRERRRIVGDVELQPQDFYANRCYNDTVNIACSNFDTHGFIVHPMFMLKPTSEEPHFAKVPFRALLPQQLDNLLVTGLAVSAHRDCMPLIRMQPDVQNQGYAAGLAAAMTAATTGTYRELNIRELQQKLVELKHLPPTVLDETDAIPGVAESDPHYELASIFIAPERAHAELAARFAVQPDLHQALILAFLGDGCGRDLLEKHLAAAAWDEGWNYRGMGQFGFSVSPIDATIFALAKIGGGLQETLQKLTLLDETSAFSHLRAVCQMFTEHPTAEAVPELERLLHRPNMRGFAIRTYEDAIYANRDEVNDTSFRNSQLKEFYLARALAACDPQHAEAAEILRSYRYGLMGYFSLYA